LSGISYPDEIEVGMKVIKIGYSSVKYGLGIFRKGEEKVSAFGEFVHVFVNRNSKKPVEIPKETKKALEDILE
jgi:acyl-CoA thioester hydrolase